MDDRKSFADLTSLHQAIGAMGEEYIFDLLQSFGIELEKIQNFCASFDFTYGGGSKHIEVKTSYKKDRDNGKGRGIRWQFNLTTKHGIDDYIAILVLIDSNGTRFVYFVPGDVINSKMIQITSHPDTYRGKYAQYLWDIQTLENYLNS